MRAREGFSLGWLVLGLALQALVAGWVCSLILRPEGARPAAGPAAETAAVEDARAG
jgi:hypothetical protein